MKIYRLETASDDDGNSPYETLCLGTGGASFDFDMTRKREDARHWLQNPLRGAWCGEGLATPAVRIPVVSSFNLEGAKGSQP